MAIKTQLTGDDLRFISELLGHQLNITHSDSYKERCIRIHQRISNALEGIKIEIKDAKR